MQEKYWWVKTLVDITGSLKALPVGEIVEGECAKFAKPNSILATVSRLNKRNADAGRGAAFGVEMAENNTKFKIEKLAECVADEEE